MKVVHNSWFPFGNYSTLNFFGILFTKSEHLSPKTINHESIHSAQMKEMLWIGFYLWYGLEYLFIRFFHKTQNCSYHDVSLEEEAYANDDNLNYLQERKHYAWWKYVKVKSNHHNDIAC